MGARLRVALPYLAGGSVLDAGCNVAEVVRYLPANVDYLGLEVVPEIVEIARWRFPDRQFECLDLEGPWPETVAGRQFDHVLLLAVLEHLRQPLAVLRQAAEVLAPDGTVILTTPHPRARWVHGLGARWGLFSRDADAEHERFLGRAELYHLAGRAGLNVIHYRTFQLGLNQLAILSRDARPDYDRDGTRVAPGPRLGRFLRRPRRRQRRVE
jgi:SAM-dependent methyltransferase